MRRSVRIGLIAAVSAAAVLAIVVHVRGEKRRQVEGQVAEARALLFGSFASRPRFEDVDAARAAELLDIARSSDHAAQVDALLHCAHAIEDLQRGDLILARGELAGVIAAEDKRSDFFALRSAVARKAGSLDEAVQAIRTCLQIDPSNRRGLLLAAEIALETRNLEEAGVHLSRLTALEPEASSVAHLYGLVWSEGGQEDRAEAAFRRAQRLDPADARPLLGLGLLFLKQQRFHEALAQLDKAVGLCPTCAEVRLGRGMTSLSLSDFDAAESDFRRALELSPGNPECVLAMGDLARARGELAEAVSRYRSAVAIDPRHAGAWVKLGHGLLLSGDPEGAEAAYRRALGQAPDLSAAHNGLGVALERRSMLAEARASFERAAELDPNDPNPRRNLSRLDRQGDRRVAPYR